MKNGYTTFTDPHGAKERTSLERLKEASQKCQVLYNKTIFSGFGEAPITEFNPSTPIGVHRLDEVEKIDNTIRSVIAINRTITKLATARDESSDQVISQAFGITFPPQVAAIDGDTAASKLVEYLKTKNIESTLAGREVLFHLSDEKQCKAIFELMEAQKERARWVKLDNAGYKGDRNLDLHFRH